MSKWRKDDHWCDDCGVYDCAKHSLTQALLTAVLAGGMVGVLSVGLWFLAR